MNIYSLVIFHLEGTVIKRVFKIKHLVQDHTQWIDITFMRINGLSLAIMKINLRGHGIGSSAFLTKNCQFRANGLSEPKIRYLDSIVLKQDVLKLEIPVNDVLFVEIVHSLDDLLKIANIFLNRCLAQSFPQITITKF